MQAQITIEFTIIMTLFLLMFVMLLVAVRTVEKTWTYEKKSIELKILCNTVADSIMKKNINNVNVKIFVPYPTIISYRRGYLICQRDSLTATSPVPGGFKPSFNGEIFGWVEV